MPLSDNKNVVFIAEVDDRIYLLNNADMFTDYTRADFVKRGVLFPNIESALHYGDSLCEVNYLEFGVQVYNIRFETEK